MPPDVCFNDLKFIIEFVYKGEIDVSQAELQVRKWQNRIAQAERAARAVCPLSERVQNRYYTL